VSAVDVSWRIASTLARIRLNSARSALLGIACGLAIEEGVPVVAWTEAAVLVLHRPVPEFVCSHGVGRRLVVVPSWAPYM